MRRLLFGSIVPVALLAIGGAAFAWQASNYRNIPGPITGSYAGGIKGSFEFHTVAAPNGIPSAPSGGACIIFRAKDLGFDKMSKKRCHSDGDCSIPGENDYGYCDTQNNKCWSRPLAPPVGPNPDDYLCLRSISPRFPTPTPINSPIEISSTPAAISTPSWKISKHPKARVLTCLNGIPGGGCGGAPGAAKPAYEWGTPEQL
jgi:hypothetical protein